ncbi:MAG: hypothetical protein OWR52_00075 [Acidibacillus sp.]|nr:hypothetical protein [Acidibacillus sp.]
MKCTHFMQQRWVDQGPFWNAHSCYFHDPSGNIAEFIARHTLPHSNSTTFSATAVTGVSEIGLPVIHPVNIVVELEKNFGLEALHDGGFPNFVGMGSDEGLFIVVEHQRPWFPTREIPVQSSLVGKIKTGSKGLWHDQNGLYQFESF